MLHLLWIFQFSNSNNCLKGDYFETDIIYWWIFPLKFNPFSFHAFGSCSTDLPSPTLSTFLETSSLVIQHIDENAERYKFFFWNHISTDRKSRWPRHIKFNKSSVWVFPNTLETLTYSHPTRFRVQLKNYLVQNNSLLFISFLILSA